MIFRPKGLYFLHITTKPHRRSQAKNALKSINFNKLSKIGLFTSSSKKGLMPIELGRAVNKAFDLRQRADYRGLPNITQEHVELYFEQNHNVIYTVGALLKASKGV